MAVSEQPKLPLSDEFRDGMGSIAVYIVGLAIFAIWIPLIFAATEFAALGVFAYLGIAVYYGSLDEAGKTQSIDEVEEPESVKVVLTLVMFIYFNSIIFFAIAFGAVFVQEIAPWVGIPVAAAIPIIDGELAQSRVRVSLLMGLVLVGLGIAAILQAIGYIGQLLRIGETIEESMTWLRERGGFQAETARRMQDAKRMLI